MKKLLLMCMAAVATPWVAQAELPSSVPPIEWPKQYIAETVATIMGTTAPGKLYVDGDKIRSETKAGGMDTISIVRPDKKLIYSIMPAQKMYMEMAYNDKVNQADPARAKGTWEQVGTETVNEQPCTKYKVTTEYQGQKTVAFFWVNKEKLPVRMATEDGRMTTDYVSIKKETPPASMFEPPVGYTKMNMSNGMSGGAPSNPGVVSPSGDPTSAAPPVESQD